MAIVSQGLNTSKKKVLTKAEIEAKREAQKKRYLLSDTFVKVNNVNKETKQYTKSLKGARALLLAAKGDKANSMTENFRLILTASKKSDLVWKHMNDNVRRYGNGNVGTHVVLQWLKKHETELLEMRKSGK